MVVGWNTLPFLKVLVEAVHRFSPAGTEIVVVDNHSTDGSREWLRGRHDLLHVLLPLNVGHGPALDIGVARVHTDRFVALDVDAFPVTAEWLPVLRAHLDAGNEVVGGHIHRQFVHPSLLAMRTRRFLDHRHTFRRPPWPDGAFVEGTHWDVGERISMREQPRVALIEPSEVRGPARVGTVYGGIVYHCFYATQGAPDERAAVADAFGEAVARYLPGTPAPDPSNQTSS